MGILVLEKSCISQVGVLLFWVLTVVQSIKDNFWDNIGTNSWTVFEKILHCAMLF